MRMHSQIGPTALFLNSVSNSSVLRLIYNGDEIPVKLTPISEAAGWHKM